MTSGTEQKTGFVWPSGPCAKITSADTTILRLNFHGGPSGGGEEKSVQNHPAMAPDLKQLYNELLDDFDWRRRKWSEFQELYVKGQERIDLLNETASNFFYFLQRFFFEDAMLNLSRLTDPARMMGNQTLSVLALPDAISDPALKAAVQKQIKEVQKNCAFARSWRNKRIAHSDLTVRRQSNVQTLPKVESTHVDAAIKSIRDLLTLIGTHYGQLYTVLASDPWGAKSLIPKLERAKRSIEEERQHWLDAAKRHG